jgi:hypothetical protein
MEEERLDQETTLILIQAAALKTALEKVAKDPGCQSRKRALSRDRRVMSGNGANAGQ